MPRAKKHTFWFEKLPQSDDKEQVRKTAWDTRLAIWNRSARGIPFREEDEPGQIDWELGGLDKDDRD